MKAEGFSVANHPMGVVFNPITIGQWLVGANSDLSSSILCRDDVWLSYWGNSSFFALSEDDLIHTMIDSNNLFISELSRCGHLFVTFGTAWVYRLKSTGELVGNCHKLPRHLFQKELLSVGEMFSLWSKVLGVLSEIHPDINVVFTVSPVRHIKDGLVDNTRSKSRLLECIHQLKDAYENVDYLPVYEFFMDELRDYAWFGADGIHPNDLAIDRVWEEFKSQYLNGPTKELNKEFLRLKSKVVHRSIHPSSAVSIAFQDQAKTDWISFLKKHPYIEENMRNTGYSIT